MSSGEPRGICSRRMGVAALTCLVAMACTAAEGDPTTRTNDAPRVFVIDGERLMRTRVRVHEGDAALEPAVDRLAKEAEAALSTGPFSVMDKPFVPPSGDKHDYMSVGPYWWPDPDTDDGLPYVRRDGVVNPKRNEYDNVWQGKMVSAVETLALAFYLTDDERYAQHAARLLRVWYLDEATRMNANLQFGQAIPGRCEGRGIGIIDTSCLVGLIDAVGMLQGAEAWTAADQEGLQQWFAAYLDWLLTHKYGRDEGRARNNHGTWYDAQVVSFALFVDKKDLGRSVLAEVARKRIATQIEPEGRQPHELARTKPFGYSIYNLSAFFALAALGDNLDIDLWTFMTEDGRGVRPALDWLVDHAFGGKEWPCPDRSGVKSASLFPLLRRAAIAYDEPAYERHIAGDWVSERMNLTHPKPETE